MQQQALGSKYREDLEKTRLNVAALVANERLEMKHKDARVVRAYTERLISEAVENGDRHTHTMEMAKWWLDSDKAAVHKLFQVRFIEHQLQRLLKYLDPVTIPLVTRHRNRLRSQFKPYDQSH